MSTTAPAHPRFREDVLEHLWRRFPAHCVVMTDPRSRQAIDVAIARAARHRFHTAAEVRSFSTLMLFLGSHFDEDRQLPWVGESLRRSAGRPRRDALTELLAETSKRMEPVVGRRGEYYRRALAWSSARSFDELAAYGSGDEGLRGLLRQLHRRKHDALGDVGVGQLIHDAHASAEHHGLVTMPGLVVVLALMFLLGSAFDRDPFHPWAGEALAASRGADPTERARDLHTRALEILGRFTRLDGLTRTPEAKG
jgi:hypothetical protein